jgi:hypothetical protein
LLYSSTLWLNANVPCVHTNVMKCRVHINISPDILKDDIGGSWRDLRSDRHQPWVMFPSIIGFKVCVDVIPNLCFHKEKEPNCPPKAKQNPKVLMMVHNRITEFLDFWHKLSSPFVSQFQSKHDSSQILTLLMKTETDPVSETLCFLLI